MLYFSYHMLDDNWTNPGHPCAAGSKNLAPSSTDDGYFSRKSRFYRDQSYRIWQIPVDRNKGNIESGKKGCCLHMYRVLWGILSRAAALFSAFPVFVVSLCYSSGFVSLRRLSVSASCQSNHVCVCCSRPPVGRSNQPWNADGLAWFQTNSGFGSPVAFLVESNRETKKLNRLKQKQVLLRRLFYKSSQTSLEPPTVKRPRPLLLFANNPKGYCMYAGVGRIYVFGKWSWVRPPAPPAPPPPQKKKAKQWILMQLHQKLPKSYQTYPPY